MTPEQISAQQKSDAVKNKILATSLQAPPTTLPAVPHADSPIDRYIEKAGTSLIIGKLIKFTKAGDFVYSDSEKKLPDDAEYLAHVDQVVVGWIKFQGPGNPPEKIMGRLFDGYSPPEREELDENNPEQWPIGISGKQEDPWKETSLLVLENTKSRDFVTFNPSSPSQVNAVRRLIGTYRMRMEGNGLLPIVKLQAGGYQHKKFGWITTPELVVRGSAKPDGSVIPAMPPTKSIPPTTAASEMDDSIPF